MKKILNKKQKGFSVLAIILLVVAVVVAIGVWAMSGNSNNSSLSKKVADVEATSIIQNATKLQQAYDALRIEGYTKDTIYLTRTPALIGYNRPGNIYNPTTGIPPIEVSSKALKDAASLNTSEGFWVYNNNVQTSGLGSSGVAQPAILLAGINDTVCSSINKILTGSTTAPKFDSGSIATPPLLNAGNVTNGATKINPTSTTTLRVTANKISKGCFASNGYTSASAGPSDPANVLPNENVYYQQLEEIYN